MIMLKIRIEGLEKEIEPFLKALKEQHNVLMVSKPYSNRNSQYMRVYAEIEGDKE